MQVTTQSVQAHPFSIAPSLTSSASTIGQQNARLVAQWHQQDGQLICRWIKA